MLNQQLEKLSQEIEAQQLIGSEKQIAWARDVKRNLFKTASKHLILLEEELAEYRDDEDDDELIKETELRLTVNLAVLEKLVQCLEANVLIEVHRANWKKFVKRSIYGESNWSRIYRRNFGIEVKVPDDFLV